MAGLEGARLGNYELIERIGGGGMAEVYRAKQSTAFGREVAIKVIRPGYSEDEGFRARFLREAQAISRLSHPNILPLIEFGEQGETLYLVMPLAREGTLRDLLKQRNGPLPLEEVVPLFTQLCDAVQYAHEQGIVHRDLKPQNVLMQRRTHVFLADFGIARDSAETQQHLTATGAGIGTVEYMAPEQALGQSDHRSDIYSLGIVLYQLLTGTVPFSGTTPFQIIMKQTNEPLPDPRTFNSALPAELLQVLRTALSKDPNQRFQSAQALGRAVQQIRPDASLPASPGTALRPPTPGEPASQYGGAPPLARTRPPVAPLDTWSAPPDQRFGGTQAEPGYGAPPGAGRTRPPTNPGYDTPPPRTGQTRPPYDRAGPPPGRGGWADVPPEDDNYDQPTWSTRSGVRQTAGGRGSQYGRASGPPPASGGGQYQPPPPRRGRGPLIAAIIAALLLVLVIATVGYGYFAAGWFGAASSPTGLAQQPTTKPTEKPKGTTEPSATATTAATATTQATATTTPLPTATHIPTATPKPVAMANMVVRFNTVTEPQGVPTPVSASCQGSEEMLSGGYFVSDSNQLYNAEASYPSGPTTWTASVTNNTAQAMTLYAYVDCLQANFTVNPQIMQSSPVSIAAGTKQPATATCPSGNVVTGGGFLTTPSNKGFVTSSIPDHAPDGWSITTKASFGAMTETAFAICATQNLASDVPQFVSFTIAASSPGQSSVGCPANQLLTGGGYSNSNAAGDANNLYYLDGPNTNFTAWFAEAYNRDSTQAHGAIVYGVCVTVTF